MTKAKGCCGNFARLMLIIFNFVFWICGCALVGIGLWILLDPAMKGLTKFLSLDEDNPLLTYASYVLIGVGAFAMIVGFCGCCGAIRLNRCLLGIYAAFVIIVIAGEIAGAVMALVKEQTIKDALDAKSRKFMYQDYNNQTKDESAYVYVVDIVQTYFACCGVSNFKEYDRSNLYNTTGLTVPWSCCERNDTARETSVIDLTKDSVDKCWFKVPAGQRTPEKWNVNAGTIETYSCRVGLENWIQTHSVILYGVGFGIAGLEIFVVMFACCLMCRIERD